LVFVGGGNTANMLAIWQVHGVDELLREPWGRGVVLSGSSAGGICWFESGITDSFGPQLEQMECLGYLSGSFYPHYDDEELRRPRYHELMRDGLLRGSRPAPESGHTSSTASFVRSLPAKAARRPIAWRYGTAKSSRRRWRRAPWHGVGERGFELDHVGSRPRARQVLALPRLVLRPDPSFRRARDTRARVRRGPRGAGLAGTRPYGHLHRFGAYARCRGEGGRSRRDVSRRRRVGSAVCRQKLRPGRRVQLPHGLRRDVARGVGGRPRARGRRPILHLRDASLPRLRRAGVECVGRALRHRRLLLRQASVRGHVRTGWADHHLPRLGLPARRLLAGVGRRRVRHRADPPAGHSAGGSTPRPRSAVPPA